MSQPTTKHTNIDAANEEIAALKAKNAELETMILRNQGRFQAELAWQKHNHDAELALSREKIAALEVEVADLQDASDNARCAFVELQYKVDLEKMPLYAERMKDDELEEAIERQLEEKYEEEE